MNTTTNQNNSDSSISQSDEKIKASEQKAEIVYIPIEKLHPHDKNPRKDVGDVTELAESIKVNGILQNLTVVPATGYWYGDYIVIIGHRRLEGAKKAGLSEVPCIIREMTEKEQIATMLLENMQRSDLTIYEQAQGMQMMLDLGESIESVAEQTGFSESTVRRRVRLATLDKDIFKATEGRQVTLADFDKLFEVEDPDKRNELLDTIGTNNFDWSLRRAKENETNKKCQLQIIEVLSGQAEELYDDSITGGLKWVDSVNSVDEIPEFMEGVTYYYKPGYSSYVSIYRDYTEDEMEQREANQQSEAAEREKRSERKSQLDELFKQAFEMRMEFVKNFKDFKGKEEIVYQMVGAAVCRLNNAWRNEIAENVFNTVMETSIETPFSFEGISEKTDWTMKTLFAFVYSVFEDEDADYYDYNGEYLENEDLDTLYDYLIRLGYEMSDEEKVLCDGTHELYTPTEKDAELDDEDSEADDIDVEKEQESDAE